MNKKMGKFQKILLLEIRYNLYFADKSVKLLAFLVIWCLWYLFLINLSNVLFSLFCTHWKNQHFHNQMLPRGPSACHLCFLKKFSTFLWRPEHFSASQMLTPHCTSSHGVRETPRLLWKLMSSWARPSEPGTNVWASRETRWDNAWLFVS